MKQLFIVFFGLCLSITLISANENKIDLKRNRPNIVWITLDAARYDRFSIYGYKKNTDPNLKQISQLGAKFTKHYSQAVLTIDSVSSMFTSRYRTQRILEDDYHSNGLRHITQYSMFRDYDSEQIFLPLVLRDYGYKTYLYAEHSWMHKKSKFARMFDETYELWDISKVENRDFSILQKWLSGHKKHPVFIYAHIMMPHGPYPEKESDKLFLKKEDWKAKKTLKNINNKLSRTEGHAASQLTKNELRVLNDLYDSNVHQVDKWVGQIYQYLRDHQIDKSTLFIVSSDHGEHLGEHDLIMHWGPAYELLTHIPLVMVYPGKIPKETIVRQVSEGIDVMPTILSLSRIKIPKKKSVDGIDLMTFIKNRNATRETSYLKQPYQSGIKTARYRYMAASNVHSGLNMEPMLFDLKKDPYEEHNIAKTNPAIVEGLQRRLDEKFKPLDKRFNKKVLQIKEKFQMQFTSFALKPAQLVHQYIHQTKFPRKIITSVKTPWLQIHRTPDRRLLAISVQKPAPLRVESRMFNGRYDLELMVQSEKKLNVNSPEDIGFRYRYTKYQPFQFPEIKFKNIIKGKYHYVFELGNTKVTNETFGMEMAFHPKSKIQYLGLTHIVFNPEKAVLPRNEKKVTRSTDEEMKSALENLKSLGYM